MPKTNKIGKLLKQSFDRDLFTKLVLPDESWARAIYGFEIFATKPGFNQILSTNNGTINALLTISGEEILAGFPYGNCPGSSITEKRHALSQMDIEHWTAFLADGKGWLLRTVATDEAVYMIPSGHILVHVSGGARHLRWGVSGDDADTSRVHVMVNQLLQDFPELGNGAQPLGHFKDWLES